MLGLTQEKFYNHAAVFTTSLAKLGELFRLKLFSSFRIKKNIKLQLIYISIDKRASEGLKVAVPHFDNVHIMVHTILKRPWILLVVLKSL